MDRDLDPLVGDRELTEGGGERDELALVPPGEVMLRGVGRGVTVVAAAAADQARFPVQAVDLAGGTVVGDRLVLGVDDADGDGVDTSISGVTARYANRSATVRAIAKAIPIPRS